MKQGKAFYLADETVMEESRNSQVACAIDRMKAHLNNSCSSER